MEREALCDPAAIPGLARAMAQLPECRQPAFAKQRGGAELAQWISRARGVLEADFPGERFVTDEVNARGRDLTAVPSGTPIELKSGRATTEANLGISTVAWALGEPHYELMAIFTRGKLERRQLSERVPELLPTDRRVVASKRAECAALAAYFRQYLRTGDDVPQRLGHLAHCVGVGITTLAGMRRALDGGLPEIGTMLYAADWRRGLIPYSLAYVPGETFLTQRVRRANEGMDAVGRLSIRIQGALSGRSLRLYPHYKNSWRPRNGRAVEAAHWVQNPCFHVWVDR